LKNRFCGPGEAKVRIILIYKYGFDVAGSYRAFNVARSYIEI
jgi:hypothetical protein